MRSVAVTINGGGNGLVARLQAYDICKVVLLDTPSFSDTHGQPQPAPEGYTPRRS